MDQGSRKEWAFSVGHILDARPQSPQRSDLGMNAFNQLERDPSVGNRDVSVVTDFRMNQQRQLSHQFPQTFFSVKDRVPSWMNAQMTQIPYAQQFPIPTATECIQPTGDPPNVGVHEAVHPPIKKVTDGSDGIIALRRPVKTTPVSFAHDVKPGEVKRESESEKEFSPKKSAILSSSKKRRSPSKKQILKIVKVQVGYFDTDDEFDLTDWIDNF
jgi:hypothetical protein